MEAAKILPTDFWLHHVNCINNFLRLLLFRVEFHVTSRPGKILYSRRNFGKFDSSEISPRFPDPLPQRSLFRLSDFSKDLLDVAGGERGSPSDSDFSLHQIEKVLSLELDPSFSFHLVVHTIKNLLTGHAIVQAAFG